MEGGKAAMLCASHALRETCGLAGFSKLHIVLLAHLDSPCCSSRSHTLSNSGEPVGSHGSITPPIQLDIFS